MKESADFVVIGGGILGASVAHFLSKHGFREGVLLEKGSLGGVSTRHSAANVRTYYSNAVTVQLAWRAVEMFENDVDQLGGDCGFQQIGFLILLGAGQATPGQHVLQLQRQYGVALREVAPDDIRQIAPQLDLKGVEGGILEERSGYADPVATTCNLAKSATQWGLEIREGVSARGICTAGSRVTGVETDQGVIHSPRVINAAGPWGPELDNCVGKKPSIRWSRESDLVLRLPDDFGSMPVISDAPGRSYFRMHGNGTLLAGLGAPKEIEPLDREDYNEQLDARTRKRIETTLFARLPQLRQAEFVQGWASIYTITDDWHPLVGLDPDLEGYYVCYGGSGHCFKIGPPIGEALASIIAGRKAPIDIHALRPTRFVEGEPLTSAWGDGNRG